MLPHPQTHQFYGNVLQYNDEPYLDEPQDTEFKRTINTVKQFKCKAFFFFFEDIVEDLDHSSKVYDKVTTTTTCERNIQEI